MQLQHRHPERRHRPASSAEPIGRRFKDEARFLKSWFDNPLLTGAIAPSSPALARAMASMVDPSRPGPVIELGPGTGPVTESLIAHGIAEHRLVLIEYDSDFCELLRRRFPQSKVIQGDAYALDETLRGVLTEKAAAIVSSLPLLTRPESERARLVVRAFGLMSPEAPFVQFTYGLVSPIPRGPGLAAEVSPPVWLNIPPARVWSYRRSSEVGHTGHRKVDADFIRKLKEHTGKVRTEFLERTGKVIHAIEERTDRVRHDDRIKPTLDLLKRINAHLEGPDTHVAADAALRRRRVTNRAPKG